jgi:hypothetical protein
MFFGSAGYGFERRFGMQKSYPQQPARRARERVKG